MSREGVIELEKKIADHFDRSYCVLLGSGTTALYCAFAYLKTQSQAGKTDILFPEITCETAVNAAIFAGFKPRFSDISRSSYVMTPDCINSVKNLESVAAIVPTHIFGHLVDITELERQFDLSIPFIEDAAQGYGGLLGNRLAGSMGKTSIISFGPGKILDCSGGGALLTNDLNVVDFCRGVAKSLSTDVALATISRQNLMKEMLVANKSFRLDRTQLLKAQHSALFANRDGYLLPFDSSLTDSIKRSLNNLSTIREERNEFATLLDTKLQRNDAISVPERAGKPALWRYSINIDDDSIRVKSIESIKRQGYKVSKLFQPCSKKFSAMPSLNENAKETSKSIINITFPDSIKQYASAVDAIARAFDS